MADFDFDAVVVGAGAVGLACGYALARRGLTVAVLEKDVAIGQGVSSRNSEVVHGGLYYATGSLKARLCVRGRRALYAFMDKHHVAYDRCGKLVVAASAEELPAGRDPGAGADQRRRGDGAADQGAGAGHGAGTPLRGRADFA